MKTISDVKRVFMSLACERVEGFTVDKNNRELIGSLFDYFMGVEGHLDLNKGLWLMGGVGTGKTTLMRLFSEFMRTMGNGFKLHACSQIATEYASTGNLDLYTYNREGYLGQAVAMCFDDLGREPEISTYYGQRLNVMQHILHIRYALWQSSGVRTFVTTNCNPDDVEEFYGDYIRDRVREMCNVLVLDGESRRCL